MKKSDNLSQPKTILVGGQAIMEGVMMRTPGAYASAVRNPDGEIITERKEFESLAKRKKFWSWPIFRGMVSMFESMKIGVETLNFSADIAFPEDAEKSNGFFPKVGEFLATVFAFALAFLLFVVAPMWVSENLLHLQETAFLFNLAAGGMRIIFFVLYLLIISMLKDVKRLFHYHGAEHKTIFAFENGEELSPETVKKYPRFHPRCGTSFLFISIINVILCYAVLDAVLINVFDLEMTIKLRLLLHIPFAPLVIGLGYEILKFSSRHLDKWYVAWIAKPGLWLQRITTQEPDDGMIECAIAALKAGFAEDWDKYKGGKYTAEAVE